MKLLRHGYYDSDRERHVGKFAKGFEARDGFNLREIDDWTPAQKAKVTRYFNQVDKLMARPFTIVRSRKPENLKLVQEAAQHQEYLPDIKVAFVPVARPGEPTEVIITRPTKAEPKKRVIIRERGVKREPVTFERAGLGFEDLADDIDGAVATFTEQFPGKLYVPLAGEYEMKGQATNAGALAGQLAALMDKYSEEEGHDPDDPNSHYWENWLFGVAVYDFRTQKEFTAFRRERTAASKALQLKRRRDRYAFRKKHGKRK